MDYTNWDWLPRAADELENYVRRLLAESGVEPHDVSARAKSIASFQRKQDAKQYADPMAEITDIVAIRIITYSNTDRERVRQLIKSRFAVLPNEDRNPGDEKPPSRRGYDCLHIVVSGEHEDGDSDWIVAGGDLERFFRTFGGLEVQIRTVAGHAWAEFEHARRYKGPQYKAVSEQDQGTIDQLFGAASDARRALDETFVAIERILARPTVDVESDHSESPVEPPLPQDEAEVVALEPETLAPFLRARFPDDGDGSEKGVEFAIELCRLLGIDSVDALEAALENVDSDQVRALMNSGAPVTRVRRLDDELLARFGQDYIDKTSGAGTARHRALQLEWRYDRLRGKTRYRTYLLAGTARPSALGFGPYTAVGALREVVRTLALLEGPERVLVPGYISHADDLPTGMRAKWVPLQDYEGLWVASNLNREASEQLMAQLLAQSNPVDLRVVRDDVQVADGRQRSKA
ncbi:RelA/SpoT domain-containing protein [Curtobacterium flaccumfaciens]|nr:RelA/SpoT domain-containing protein [Curtobacterium flaccumfaciens]